MRRCGEYPDYTRSVPVLTLPSHAEHAGGGFFDRRIERGRQAECQHLARVEWIDHAVVPQPRGGVIGAALARILFEDRRLERAFLGGAPRLAGFLQRVAL